MKTFKDIVSEVAQPLAGDEKRFKEKHKVDTIGDPQNNGDKLYKGSEIKKDKTKKASYEDGEDSKVYEEVELDKATHSYKAATFNGNVVKGTGKTKEAARKDAEDKAKALGSVIRKRLPEEVEEVEMDEAKGEDAYYARYGAGGKKKSPEEVAADKRAAAIKKDRESYSKMRKDLGTDDYATTKKIVGEEVDMNVRTHYAQEYIKLYKKHMKSNPNRQAISKAEHGAYNSVENKYGFKALQQLKDFHNKNMNENNQVEEKIDVYKAMKDRYGKDFKKKSPEEVAADKEKEKEVKKKSEMSKGLEEKKLTPAEMKKREEVAKAIERENPNMPMGRKMAIATATAKKVAESINEDIKNKIAIYRQDGSFVGLMNNFSDAQKRYPGHVFHSIQTKPIKESEDENIAKVNESMTQPKQTPKLPNVNAGLTGKTKKLFTVGPKLPNVNDGLTGKAKELFTVEAGETPPSLGSPTTPRSLRSPTTPIRISPPSKAQKWLKNLKAPYSGHPQGGEEDVPLSWSNKTESYDAEGEMAKTELRAIAHKALQLHSMMEDDDQLESWLQSKITKAKYMIDSVYDYIVYNMPDDQDDEPAEDYMSALPYPNRPVGGMYGEDVNENVYNIKPTSVDKGIAAASARKPKTEEVESIDETSPAKAKRYLDAQDKELASGKVATEGPRKSINRMVGYSRAKEILSPKQMLHLDRNKNNKIDAQDFELLRKEKNK